MMIYKQMKFTWQFKTGLVFEFLFIHRKLFIISHHKFDGISPNNLDTLALWLSIMAMQHKKNLCKSISK